MADPFGAVDLTGGSQPPVSDWVSEVGTRGEVDDADAHSAPSISRAFPTPAPTPLAPIGVTKKVTSATPQSKTGDPDGSNITDGQSSQKPLAQRKPSMEITREMEQKSPALPKVKELSNAVAQSKPVEAQTTRIEAPAIKTTRKSLTETETDVNKTASPSSKRLLPGKLDIAAATRNLIKETQAITAATAARKAEKEKEMQKQKQSQKASEGSTPGSLSAAAHNQEFPPLRQSNPRTLRVVQTPKTEVRPSTPAPSASSATAAAPSSVSSVSTSVVPGSKAPSRRPSVNSLTQPATPGSELVSDNASFTTAPLSRANSPPLKVSKSQSKKQRRVAKKTLDKKEPEEVLIKIAEPEAEHAPIVGRKKKKSKQAAISDDVAAAASGSMDERQQQEWVQPLSSGEKKDENGVATGTAAASSADATAGTEEARSKRQSLATPLEESGVPMAASAPTTPDCEVTTATLLASLIESRQLDPATHPFFQPVKSFSHRPAVSPREFADVTRKIYVTPAETDMLQNLKAVRHDGSPPHEHLRFMISPGGYFLRGMPKETEDRFLELEASIRSARSSTVFQPAARERRIPAMASSVAEPAVMAIDTPTEEFTPVSHFSWDESFSVGSSTGTSTSTGTRDRKQLLSAGRYGVEEIGKAWAEEKRKAALLERKLGSLSKRNREWLREAGFKL
ncbi:MAG: hypothetical protein M1825_005506 [Sarcosagium campestre]|nr:MAG: hypothetical protein M1825_005506 [Sarcosagium campestre]